jgi:hypothetical protein
MAGVKGSAFSGEQVCARLPETGLYSDQTELLLRNLQPSAELTVYGPAAVLDSLKVWMSINFHIKYLLTWVSSHFRGDKN